MQQGYGRAHDQSPAVPHINISGLHRLAPRFTPLLKLGYKRSLTMEDEFALPHNLKTNRTYPHFWAVWTKQMEAAPLTAKVTPSPSPWSACPGACCPRASSPCAWMPATKGPDTLHGHVASGTRG